MIMQKIINYGLVLLILILPLQTRLILEPGQLALGPWEYGTISFYATDILIILLLAATILFLPKKDKGVRNSFGVTNSNWPLYALAGLVLFFSALSLPFSPNWQLSCFALLRLILGVGLFWTIIQSKIDAGRLWLALIIGATASAALGIWQFLTQTSFANKWLGLALHESSALGTSVVEMLGADGQWERWLRAYGPLDHPNMLGGLLAVAILALLFIVIASAAKQSQPTRLLRRSTPQDDNQKSTVILTPPWRGKNSMAYFYALLPLLTTGLFFTFSRAAFIALAVGLIAFVVIYLKQWKAWLPAVIIFFITFLPLTFIYRPLLASRFIDPPRIEVKSIDERLSYLDNAWQLIAAHPWEGVGLGNHTWAVFSQVNDRQISWWYQPVHNTYLLVWSEIGLLGAFAFIGLLLYLLYQQWHGQSRNTSRLRRGLTIQSEQHATRNTIVIPAQAGIRSAPLLLALLTLLLFDHWLWSLHFGVLFFWLIIALISKVDTANQPPYNKVT